MKKNKLHIVMAVFGLLGFHALSVCAAASSTNALTVRFSITALAQAPLEAVTNATSTNIILKVNKFRFASKDMLNLLASEFNTTFPDGAQLGITPNLGFVVLDKTGNIFLNVSTNLTDTNYVFNITNNSSSFVEAGKFSITGKKMTSVTSEIVPDFTISYADGKGNHFHFGGLATIKLNTLFDGTTATLKTISYMISGSGGGVVFNPNDGSYDTVVLTGLWMAIGANLAEPVT